MADERSKSSASKRHNKLYRTPPTPPPVDLLREEKGFVLDCNAVSSISLDYSKANPKLGPVIPPYNSQKDGHVENYFNFHGVDKTLKKTGQVCIYFSISAEHRCQAMLYYVLGYANDIKNYFAEF